jgi:hypothetical protein
VKFDAPATTNPIDQLKIVGQPVDRIDGRLKDGRAWERAARFQWLGVTGEIIEISKRVAGETVRGPLWSLRVRARTPSFAVHAPMSAHVSLVREPMGAGACVKQHPVLQQKPRVLRF